MTRNVGIRPSLPTSSTAIQIRGDLSAASFSKAAQLALYNRAQGAMVAPFCGSSTMGSSYNTGTSSETFRFAYWSSGVHFQRCWIVKFRWNSRGEVTLTAGSSSITVNLGFKQDLSSYRETPNEEDVVYLYESFTASSGRHTPTLVVNSTSATWAVADIGAWEVPRSVLAANSTDLGLNAGMISADAPIRGEDNVDWGGIYDIARTPTIKRGSLYALAIGEETVGGNVMIARQGFTAGAPTANLFDSSILGPYDDYPRMTAPIINTSTGGKSRVGVSIYYEFATSASTITGVTFTWYDTAGNTYTKTGGSTGGSGGSWVHFDVTGSNAPQLSHDDESNWTATDTISRLAFTITTGGAVVGNLGIKSLCVYEVP